MGLETRKLSSLWKDQALVAINVAVIHSYQVNCPSIFCPVKCIYLYAYWFKKLQSHCYCFWNDFHENRFRKYDKAIQIFIGLHVVTLLCRKIRSPSRTTIQQASPSCSTWRQKSVCVEAVQLIGCGWSRPCLAPSPPCTIRRCSTTSFLPSSITRYQTLSLTNASLLNGNVL